MGLELHPLTDKFHQPPHKQNETKHESLRTTSLASSNFLGVLFLHLHTPPVNTLDLRTLVVNPGLVLKVVLRVDGSE